MKRDKIAFWISTIFLALFEGVMPLSALLVAPASASAGIIHLNYPPYFTYVIIAFKVLGTIVLLIPRLPARLKEWAYAGFTFNFICASVSHFVVDGFVFDSFFPLVILGIAIISYRTYFKAYQGEQTQQGLAFA